MQEIKENYSRIYLREYFCLTNIRVFIMIIKYCIDLESREELSRKTDLKALRWSVSGKLATAILSELCALL